jgi:hypothetical protein
MSLSIGPNLSIYPRAATPRQADPAGGAALSGQLAPNGSQSQQAGRSQVTDQINITSITVNINQTATAPSSSQLRVEVDRATRLGNGDSTLQPLAEGYFSSPTNFVPIGSLGGSSSATSEVSVTLQILSETTNASVQAKSQPTDKVGAAVTPVNTPSDNSAYSSVDISI